ncbi:MAG TPA: glycoside hydrolase family 10 protein [Nostocaceae cyanobacterium]|nr:glycoside hydrolase family 10 protein [Nostocaceae cyanobacterium]
MNWVSLRAFLFLVCLGFVATVTFLPISVTPIASQPSNSQDITTEIRGVWLTNVASGVLFMPWGINRALNQLAALNFNTIYPVVWNRGFTFYNSDVAKPVTGYDTLPLLKLMHGGSDVLAKLVRLSKNKGLSVIPWFEYGLMTPPHSTLAKSHPEWLTMGQSGINLVGGNLEEEVDNGIYNRQAWLNPLHPQVQDFIKGLIVEVVKNYDVDGIQLDDHFGMPVQFGYDALTIQLYQQEHQGQHPPQDPFDEKWMRWRADKITNLMKEIYQAVKAIKPYVKISLSPNSQYYAYRYYLQDWQSWVNQNLVDELILQVYRHDQKSFMAELEKPEVQLARGKIPVGVGISAGTLRYPVKISQIQEQVQAVRDRSFSGISFFYWESLWGYITPDSPRQRRRTFADIFTIKAVKPLKLEKL